MPADNGLTAAFSRLADAIASRAEARAALALALERDRHDAELAELREDVAALGIRVAALERELTGAGAREHHSVRVSLLPEEGR